MQNRWSDSEAESSIRRYAPSWDAELALLTYATRLLGADPDLALHGGGNTSHKGRYTDLFGEPRAALFVKGSGVDLATIEPDDFVALDLPYVTRMVELERLSDQQMSEEFGCHQWRPSRRRASVETLLHATLAQPWVMHTHPSAVLALTNRSGASEALAAALGPEVVIVPYVRAGLDLARAVRHALAERGDGSALVLMHHGLVTWGSTLESAYAATIELVNRAQAYLERTRSRRIEAASCPAAEREQRYRSLGPVLRGVLGPTDPNGLRERVVLDALLDPAEVALLDAPEGRAIALSTPLTPDYLIRTRRLPLWVDAPPGDEPGRFRDLLVEAIAAFREDYRSYLASGGTRSFGNAPELGPAPRVILVPTMGVVTVGRTAPEARMVLDITRQSLRVKAAIYSSSAEYLGLDDEHLFDMEFRAYQQAKVAAPGSELESTVAIVTGAAGAIGTGICEALLGRGCHVAATDLAGPALDELGQRLADRHGPRVLAVPMDVTDPSSVCQGFAAVSRRWGGVDAVVVNAGIAHVAPLAELSLESFRRLERVNVEGTLLVLAEAARHFALERTGGDIVLVSTKNVFAPGAGFGAYSATKAASHQLARIASLELAPLGVRVNMVAPDAVFSHGEKRSGLWAEVGPNRMKARGLDERGLEEYYRSRNLLKATVTAEHVARAVLFFITHQTPTTGVTLPVDGGLPDATPR